MIIFFAIAAIAAIDAVFKFINALRLFSTHKNVDVQKWISPTLTVNQHSFI